MTAPGFGAALALRGASKSYSDTVALQPTDLDVEAGEFVTLLGPSGCGKTTLLRIVAGLTEPTAGRVILDGQDVTADPPERREVNLVFQSYALFPHLDVAGNIEYGLRARGVPREEAGARVSETLAAIGLAGLASRRVSELSGGQAQRVALARALVNRPKVLLLDEPLSALDLQLRKQMQHELRRVHRTFRTTFVYVTHDQAEALTLSDRIVVMNGGAIEQIGTPPEIYRNPSSAFVAAFVGESSILRGTVVERRHGRIAVRLAASGRTIEARPGTANASPDGEVAVVIRPEAVALAENGTGHVEGTVADVWFAGDCYAMRIELPGDPTASLRVDAPATASAAAHSPGDSVALELDFEALVAVSAGPGAG